MNSNRSLLVMGLLLVSFLIFTQWQQDFNPEIQAQKQAQQQAQVASQSGDVPAASNANTVIAENATQGKTVTLESDVLRLTIDTLGGDVIASDLLAHNAELNSQTPFKLLQTGATTYVAQSGLVGKNGIDTNAGRPQYQVAQDTFVLAEGQNEMSVPMTFEKDGVLYTKTFVLKRGSYDVAVNFNVKNQTAATVEVQPYGQIKYTLLESSGSLTMPTYTGGAYSSAETNYKKYSFQDMEKANLDINTKAGWVALLQHYFVSAWVPNQDAENTIYSRTNNGIATIGYRGPVTTIAPNSEATITSQLWTGPKDQKEMEATAANLDLTVDYGWAWFIAKPLFALLTFIQSIVTNWGLAIIGVTIVVKTILYPLTKAQYTSMARMRMLQPKIQEMRERFGDDRQRMSQEMMKLYKEEKVNPMGGCLPILIQMPIFIALYWTFMEAVELRHAPFFGWIQDLSAQDPYYILPLLMGASMFLLQKMSPSPVTDPVQQKVMTFMPVMFTVFFLWFPSGLVLYWLTSNIITIVQQWLIYRNLEKKGLHSRKK
ncbi:60 kD inner-membrane protein [Actinobacillus pleuropneumoniae serovar 3 str. JL03]|uniref:Membrane protein insertase YidC n=1 Tax=Actinobacillus pleuropneumoniae serotype 3 (strain JL03) TaxID=434271 RepID=YIDC_ACTPJ|nr:membrane protein insertase YidC [Actinobacillus pleuropneumoniae]B0BR23.1 RecName: Full=Membrane protein insertase YidC; AltName: Full=Foldase YidC; AltName: Full=Membrane integrase YidC; AltName: Full=Membrane protein YidC [Actinobacillus pleuropneumoniae serovar 3 str. JL03]ABY70008.1 60 kD inner-membrane protein [Actinobacillus pleuropneumoniae serovar 3 str. JL03]UKH14946.1 membrane protein insertase YidC [Actinobacillus pleuropneumoniae]UKH44126.1 membrane protein insertase YidC [Actino